MSLQPGRELRRSPAARRAGPPRGRGHPGSRAGPPRLPRTRGRARRAAGRPARAPARSARAPAGCGRISIRAASAAPNGATTAISCAPSAPALVITNSTMLAAMATARSWSTSSAPAKNRQASQDQSQRDQGQAHHVEQRHGVLAAGQPAVVGPEDLRHGPQGVQIGREVMQRELERDRVQGVAAEGAEHPLGRPGQPGRDARRRDQGQLEGPRGQGAGHAALADRRLGDPQGADQGQRNHPDDEHELVGDERPRQPQRDQHRQIPAKGAGGRPPGRRRPGPVEEQPDEQDGNRGPDVTDAQEQGGDAGAELRREHDPGGDRHPDRPRPGWRSRRGRPARQAARPACTSSPRRCERCPRGRRRRSPAARTAAARWCRTTRRSGTSRAAAGCRAACPTRSSRMLAWSEFSGWVRDSLR